MSTIWLLYALFMSMGSLSAAGQELQELRYTNCDKTSPNYTSGSSFSSNLNLALSTLRNTTPPTGFATTSSAAVTALALCRGSLTQPECQACIDAATSGIREACPSQTKAEVWYTYCTLRYAPDTFLNVSDNSLILLLYDLRNAPTNATAFDQTVNAFVRDLSVVASATDKRYGVAKTQIMPMNRSLYGYVDCTRDIDSNSCERCLLDTLGALESCCSGKWATWVATPSCSIQVNMDPVHDDWRVAKDISYYMSAPAPAPEGFPGGGGGLGSGRGNGVKIGAAVGAGGGAAILGLGVVLLVLRARKRHGDEQPCEAETFVYDLDLIVAATDNFSDVLGRGGFGTVYKGKMVDGEEVAVKVLTSDSVRGHEEFMNEIRLLLKTQHRNLVRLLGCCTQGDQKMLVYEYLPNSSLDTFLFDKSKSALLDWTKRYNIIMGIARALVYLHQDCGVRIVHRDIKASNILLDEEMNPRVSDFGLARLLANDDPSKCRTRRIAGTFGYMAPEYAIQGLVSAKGDVFSFGVLLLEIISGRKNFDPQYDDAEMQQLLKHTWRLEQEGRVREMIDVTMGSFPIEEVVRCVRVGLACTHKAIQDRPTMASALLMLSEYSTTIPLAQPDRTIGPYSHVSSQNSITLSVPTGR